MGALTVVLSDVALTSSVAAPSAASASITLDPVLLDSPVDLYPEASAQSVGVYLPRLTPLDYMAIYREGSR